jgi:DNA-binding response OmpR family regulator
VTPVILVIEDDQSAARWIKIYLERAGYTTLTAQDGVTGLAMARSQNPTLILLDLMLPGMDGREICRILRQESDTPIIMLTARSTRSDRINGLDGGADDYITKPFDPDELVVRIKAVLRRSKGQVRQSLTCGPLQLDLKSRELTFQGEPVELSQAQFALLVVFMNNKNAVLTRNQLIEQAFDNNFEAFDRAIDSHIGRLRKLIHRSNFKPLKTIYGSGYKWDYRE